MSREELRERDARLDAAQHYYESHQQALEEEKAKVYSLAQQKSQKGENIDAELQKYNELKRQQNNNFDNYKAERDRICAEYENRKEKEYQEELSM